MKESYPIIITKADGVNSYVVSIPDFETGTEGASIADAMEMARDAIGLLGIDMEDDGETLPAPSKLLSVVSDEDSIVTLVDVDFTEYRRRNDMKTVRRNVSLPHWLDTAAEAAGLNVSALLQQALKEKLGMSHP